MFNLCVNKEVSAWSKHPQKEPLYLGLIEYTCDTPTGVT